MSPTLSRTVQPRGRISGTISVQGDKSISHRAAMLSAAAQGQSAIEGFLASEDCLSTLAALESLGAGVERDGTTVRINGTGGRFRKPARPLDCGNSGTSMRLLSGLVAGQDFTCELTGDASLRSRPMKRIKEPLELMGAKVELTGDGGCAPVRITGGRLKGIEYRLPVASAQVKSCVLLAGLFAEGKTTVSEPQPTRDHTERMLKAAGAGVEVDGLKIVVAGAGPGAPGLKARRWFVPGDFSSAAFWLVAAACREGSDVTIENVGLNPRRTALIGVLRRMGAGIKVTEKCTGKGEEPLGVIRVTGARLKGAEIGGEEIPALIDELPIAAVAGAFAVGRTVIRDASELRVKESDRIAAMAKNLRALGVSVVEKPDGMIVEGPAAIRGGEVESFGDHRVAMAMAILALGAGAPVKINDVGCVNTSYPGFWDDMNKLAEGNVE